MHSTVGLLLAVAATANAYVAPGVMPLAGARSVRHPRFLGFPFATLQHLLEQMAEPIFFACLRVDSLHICVHTAARERFGLLVIVPVRVAFWSSTFLLYSIIFACHTSVVPDVIVLFLHVRLPYTPFSYFFVTRVPCLPRAACRSVRRSPRRP